MPVRLAYHEVPEGRPDSWNIAVNVVGESGYSRAVKTVTISVHGTDAQSSVTFISASGTQTHSSPVTTAIFATGGTAGTASSTYVVARKLGKRIIHGLKHLFKL